MKRDSSVVSCAPCAQPTCVMTAASQAPFQSRDALDKLVASVMTKINKLRGLVKELQKSYSQDSVATRAS